MNRDPRKAPQIFGKYRAVCRDNNDPELMGRIRVECPPIYGEHWSDWAWPQFPPNMFFVPREDDLVWIEFEMGDTRFPIWTGMWYRKGDVPFQQLHAPLNNKGPIVDFDLSEHAPDPIDKVEHTLQPGHSHPPYYDPHKFGIRSRTGHVIIVDDDPDDKGGIKLIDRAGNTIRTLDKNSESILIEDMNANKVKLSSSGILLRSPYKVRIETSSLEIPAPTIIGGGASAPSKAPKPFEWGPLSRPKGCKTDPTTGGPGEGG